ncbi:hypothetical protein [Gulosibacter bifidus]|uniref:Uncharacterized protein n=1 Tax=Gulosibacter bifidus TaxID=272239 RepID=A0ABW5RGS3_9MICO|nr:hypothetical protein [Gulosibacter bifidus]
MCQHDRFEQRHDHRYDNPRRESHLIANDLGVGTQLLPGPNADNSLLGPDAFTELDNEIAPKPASHSCFGSKHGPGLLPHRNLQVSGAMLRHRRNDRGIIPMWGGRLPDVRTGFGYRGKMHGSVIVTGGKATDKFPAGDDRTDGKWWR